MAGLKASVMMEAKALVIRKLNGLSGRKYKTRLSRSTSAGLGEDFGSQAAECNPSQADSKATPLSAVTAATAATAATVVTASNRLRTRALNKAKIMFTTRDAAPTITGHVLCMLSLQFPGNLCSYALTFRFWHSYKEIPMQSHVVNSRFETLQLEAR